jgi:hypothetical protein
MTTNTMLAMMGLSGIELLLLPLSLLFTAFWIWMLVDSAKRKQFGWLVAIALLNFLGAFAYYLFGRSSKPA